MFYTWPKINTKKHFKFFLIVWGSLFSLIFLLYSHAPFFERVIYSGFLALGTPYGMPFWYLFIIFVAWFFQED